MRLARSIIRTLLKERIHYPGRFLAESFTRTARCALVLYLYWYVFKLRGGEVNGVPYSVAAWGLFMYTVFHALRLREVCRTIMNDVRSGTIEVLFNKPISYLPYRAWWQIGNGLHEFILVLFLGSIVLTQMFGLPQTFHSPVLLLTVIITLLLSTTLSFLLYAIIGLCAFWLEEINPLYWITDKSLMILGGSYLPVALFPDFLYKIARYSPFGASQFITHTVYDSWQTDWPVLMGIQLFWLIVLLSVITLMSRAAHRKVSINGG